MMKLDDSTDEFAVLHSTIRPCVRPYQILYQTLYNSVLPEAISSVLNRKC